MKVFISWSGKTSGELAKILRDWLPSVIQAVKPYYSTDDIAKGMRGNTVIAKELEEAGVGLLCLTPDNLDAPWIMFEAGALSKKLDTSRVCPILFGGVETTDLKGPLIQFQAVKFNKEDTRKMLTMVNKQLGDDGLESKVLDLVFEKWWPDLEQKIQSLLSKVPESAPRAVRDERELLEEILTITRSMAPNVSAITHTLRVGPSEMQPPPPPISVSAAAQLARALKDANWSTDAIRVVLKHLYLPQSFINDVLSTEPGEPSKRRDRPFF